MNESNLISVYNQPGLQFNVDFLLWYFDIMSVFFLKLFIHFIKSVAFTSVNLNVKY